MHLALFPPFAIVQLDCFLFREHSLRTESHVGRCRRRLGVDFGGNWFWC